MNLKNMSMWTLIGLAGVAYLLVSYKQQTGYPKIAIVRTSASEPSGDMQLYGIETPPNWY